ncbi:hypothetical protein [Gemmatirosa kalamazoonensis]|uniref:hypothetical protein n=1 Tax=Gemmatirosa kalamazoonensis TaxID=861299 RepID=UPI0004BA40B3|nr:hypothetical protein [Gemmatirosa kalamazoonensis]
MSTSAPAATAPEAVTLDLPLRLLVWTTRTAVFALVVVGVTGIALGVLAITHRAERALAITLQWRCLVDAVVAAGLGMVAAAARAGAIDRRRRIARAARQAAAERAREEARRQREAARKAAAEREAAEAAARAESIARRAEEEARTAEEEHEREALVTAMAEATRLEAERLRAEEQRERERKATEERIERAIRDGTRAA